MNFIIIIPSRLNSKRLPNKALIDINGEKMICRVYKQAAKTNINVYVATDNKLIYDEIKSIGGKVVMTSVKHNSGTDRIAEAIEIIEKKENKKYNIVINVQGDEPYINPQQINEIKNIFILNPDTKIATLIKEITNKDDIDNLDKPKVVINKNNEAIYFIRLPIPYNRDKVSDVTFYKHIGMYAYKTEILKQLTKLPQSMLEKSEKLEQLRWIENNYKISVEITQYENISIDTIEDLKKIT